MIYLWLASKHAFAKACMCEKYTKIQMFSTVLREYNFIISYEKHIFQVEKAMSACKVLPEAVLEGQKCSQGVSLDLPLDSKQA